ncbi:DNA helicase [Mesoplasma entomophilum]|uniref:DNA helicase n=1 Tax=Mesoplasma entomophilum TaxID=2149 RepID=A0A3S5XYX1_9MOLU|nr:AAA domain-containing protein [Mesoplasma entomophilum]ATQ35474.1 hypothetical protein CS528_01695 [Mesoplasma entomophilum]ATZ19434.1 DNA helicase [Mesoplasma entomophilum]
MLKVKEKFNYWVRVANDLYNIAEQNNISMDLQEQWEESDFSDEEKHKKNQDKQKINPYSNIEYFINKTLLRKYEYINKESILYYFLNAKHKEYKNWNEKTFIYPFGINNSQRKAVENAFKSNISIIQGPPGTGKTQTILNILANILMENKTVAVVSNNNSAIDNVIEKLHSKVNSEGKKINVIDDIWFLTSFLGKKSNNEKYFSKENQQEILNTQEIWRNTLENSDYWVSKKDFAKNKFKIDELVFEIEEVQRLNEVILENKNELNKVLKELELLVLNVQLSMKNDKNLKKLSLKKLKKLHLNLKMYRKEKFTWWFKFKTRFIYQIKKEFFESDFIAELYFHILNKKHEGLELAIKNDSKYLKKIGKNKIEDLIKLSKQNLLTHIYKNFMLEDEIKLTSSNFNTFQKVSDFQNFIKKRPIILSTIYSIINSKNSSVLYDYLIIDESSQTDMLACIGAMACAKNIIVVGDLKQLPQVENKIFKKYFEMHNFEIEDGYKYFGNNILKSLLTIYKNKVPNQLLREHYRCHPGIIGFCNKKYYDNKLIIMTENSKNTNPFETIIGESLHYNDTSKTSKKEIQNIKEYLDKNKIDEIGIISPFRNQANLLAKTFRSEKIIANTIHKFQGQEKDTILFAVTKAKINGRKDFVSNPKLINVAVSRAKNKFILAYAGNLEQTPDNDIKDLLKYINYNYPDAIKNIAKNSEFYILSKEFNNDLLKLIVDYNLSHSNGTKEPSEIIIHNILEEIIKEENYQHLDITLFKKLSLLVPDAIESKEFNQKELSFLKHHWAHVDFLLYDKFSHAPVLVIEVDGLTFHKKQKQTWRDEIKDKALKMQNIPIIRISTAITENIKSKIKNELLKIKEKT